MKKTVVLILLCVLFLSVGAQIKVACVGNSITYGYGLKDRSHDSYPAILGRLLGERYEVRNFGFSARTLLKEGDRPYMKEKMFREALDYQPDIVVIKLGTNDSKPKNWKYKASFIRDLTTMVDSFQALPSNPRVYLCYPAKAYGHPEINDSTIVHGIIPAIRKVARLQKTGLINLHKATDRMPENFPDKIHPNPSGTAIIARKVYKAIRK